MDESYLQKIKHWIKLDNAIEERRKKLRDYQAQKNLIETELVQYVKRKDLSNSVIKLDDGNIKFINVNRKQQLSMKVLEQLIKDCFQKYEKDSLTPITPNILYKYIVENRNHHTNMIMKRWKKSN
jgi:hypothetical protein